MIIAALLYTPPPRQVSGSSQGGEGGTGDDDRDASLQEGANEIPSVPPPLATQDARTASDELSRTDSLGAPSEAYGANSQV